MLVVFLLFVASVVAIFRTDDLFSVGVLGWVAGSSLGKLMCFWAALG